MMLKLSGLVVLVAVAACGGKGDDCERFWTKTAPKMAKMDPKKMPRNAKEQFLKLCRDGDKMKKDPVFKCVLDASGDTAVDDCMAKAFGDYAKSAKRSEAQLNLNKLSKNVKVHHTVEGSFPIGKVGPTPAESCCKAEGGKCTTTEWATNEMWQKLEFSVDEPHQYRYAYESDGKTVTALAIGDLDCDEEAATWTLQMSVGADGVATSEIKPPPSGEY